MHTRLKRQLERHFGDGEIPTRWTPFIESVDHAYRDADRERTRVQAEGAAAPEAENPAEHQAAPIPEQMLILDGNGIVVECKGGGPSGLFLDPERSIGKKFAQLAEAPNSTVLLRAIERCRISSGVETAEVELECNGESRPCEVRLFTAGHAQVIAIVRDRPNHRPSTRTLPESRDFLHRVLDRSPGYIFVKDRDGRFTVANRAVAAAYGTVPEDLIGKTDADFNPNTEEVEAFLEADRRVIDEQTELFVPEEPVTEVSGHTRWVQTIKVPLIEPDGSCTQMLGISTDITVRRDAERKLRSRSEQILRTHAALQELALTVNLNRSDALARIARVTVRALNADRAGLLLVSEDNTTLTWSFEHDARGVSVGRDRSWETARFPNYLKALQDGQMLAVSSVEHDERVRDILEPILKQAGIQATLDVPIRIKGRLIGVLCSSQTNGTRDWTLEDQDLGASIANFASVTLESARRDEVEEQLRQAQKMEAIGLLAGGVAHDFNNLLTVILGYTEMAIDGLEADHQSIADLEQIAAAASRATDLTRSLLTFSRKHVLEIEVVDLAASIQAFHALLARIMGEDLEVVCTGLDSHMFIMGDRSQLDQVLLNLATNARQAMPNGGKLTITLREHVVSNAMAKSHGLEQGGRFAQIVVEDSGIGMSSKVMNRIWEPFFTTKGDGTGLGLSLVYGIIESHQGFVTADSKPGRGSTFRVYLPLTAAESLSHSPAIEGSDLSGVETILLAEDETSLRQLVATGLSKLGYRVIQATTGEEAVSQAKQHPEISAVILDVVMPRMSGPEALDRIRSSIPSVPALFISGYAPESSQLGRFLREPTIDLLSKPFAMANVAERLRSVLNAGRSGLDRSGRPLGPGRLEFRQDSSARIAGGGPLTS